MTVRELYQQLESADSVANVEATLEAFEAAHSHAVRWVPVGGRENNRGSIEVSGDPGRSAVERLTNGMDAILEAEYERHHGRPDCRSPMEAASAWLNIPETGLSGLTPAQRRSLAQRVTIRLLPGDGRDLRIIEVRDRGIGLTPEQMPGTILSLGESNKIQKYYLAGTYGQGGSSTFASAQCSTILTRYDNHSTVGFTVVRFLDLPPEQFKTGHYVYLTLNGRVLELDLPLTEFEVGTLVRHYGYDLSGYPSPVGPNSLYGLLNQVLFDPVLPVWFDNRVHNYRRVIKGSRNALNGAVDEDDEARRGPTLDHHVPLFYVTLGDFGPMGIEYWVLERPSQSNKRPTAAFVNPSRPIILTIHGQNHGELSSALVKKQAELPYLTQRLIIHIDSNSITPTAKRALFISTREDARRGMVYELIHQELIRVLRSDDELTRLNNEARQLGMREQDESALQQARREVARLLRLQGISIGEPVGEETSTRGERPERPTHPPRVRPQPRPIELHEPPTYIRILWEPNVEIPFYAQQRRYIRVETDANSTYHNSHNPAASRINVIVSGAGVALRGSTPLQGGRMRVILDGSTGAQVGATGTVRVELMRTGLPSLVDERAFRIIETPLARPASREVGLPPFEFHPVEGPEDQIWTDLVWPEDPNLVASSAQMEDGVLIIYYSTVFPKYSGHLAAFERRDPALVRSFTERYKIWLAVHSLLLYRSQQEVETARGTGPELDPEIAEQREREERCRVAILSAVFAAREVQIPIPVDTE